jgi:hypothetical protein
MNPAEIFLFLFSQPPQLHPLFFVSLLCWAQRFL